MLFNLNFPNRNTELKELQLEEGEMLYVLGANGAGKSSLMFLFNKNNLGHVRKVSAHRQTWMGSDVLDMTPSTKIQTEQQLQSEDRNKRSRYHDPFAAQRTSMIVYELIDAENVRARTMAEAYDLGEMEQLAKAAKVEAPVTIINAILQQSNIPIKITIRANERVMASKNGSSEYSAAELSDGERNALLIAANVLTAPPKTLLIIDEPERHLHRSIIAPLLSQLFAQRSDCGFVISTHDHDLPLENPQARTLLLRSCNFNGQDIQCWEADELPADAPIDDILKRDLIGARRKILFVEGTESSLDKSLYSLIFPEVSVIPKGNCRNVEQAVIGAQAVETLYWLKAYGIVDSDGFDADQISDKRERGVYALPYYSVEAIYFHHWIIEKIATRQASVSGGDGLESAESAIATGVAAIKDHTDRLSQKAAKKALRKSILEQIPNDDELFTGQDVQIVNNSSAIHAERVQKLETAVADSDWEEIMKMCPVRESTALNDISTTLGFREVRDYQKAVRHLLAEDTEALEYVRNLFGDLAGEILG